MLTLEEAGMQGLWLDVKSAVRQLRSAPGTAAAAILTLGVGIGATAAVFTFLAAVLSAAAPVADMERRVALWSHNRQESETKNAVSMGDFVEWRRRATLVEAMVALRPRAANIGGLDNPVRAGVSDVTPDYLQFFHWTPMLGRTFTAADARPGAPPVVILSYEFWRSSLAAAPDAIGRSLRLDGVPVTIVGVLPRLPVVTGLYVPLMVEAAAADHTTRNLFVWGRLRDGVTIDQARAEMQSIGQALENELPRTNAGWEVNTRPLQEEFVGPQARLAFSILAGTVVAVLLIGCVNIANLLLARGLARRGELAVRTALGASVWRIARQLFMECGVLAAAGAVLSIVVSRWTLNVFIRAFPLDSPWLDAGGMNGRALLFTAAATLVATVAAGLAPVFATRRPDLVSALSAAGRSGARQSRRLTGLLVGIEIGLAVLLLVIAGLLMRTLQSLERLEPGFEIEQVLTASVTLPESLDGDAAAQWFEQALVRARAVPGVVSAAATSRLPFAGSRFNPNRGLEIEGRVAAAGDGSWAVNYTVTPQFFETLRVPAIEGRTFSDGDGRDAPLVAVVNAAMAKRFWSGRSPLGARLRQGDEPDGQWRTVVGVVADIRNDDADQPPIPYLYVPLAQRPTRTMTLALRTMDDAVAVAPSLRSALSAFDPDQALYDVRSMQAVFEQDLADSRVLIQVLGAFAAIALGLAGLGVWGVAAQAVAERTREIGIRVALGATSSAVMRLMVMHVMVPMAAGLFVGLAGALAVGRLMRGILFQVSPADPVALAMAMAGLATVATLATVGPALRAACLDPVTALRER